MSETPNPADFVTNERPNEYRVSFSVRGEVSVTIQAGSVEEARAKANELAEEDDFGMELDDVTMVDIDDVRKTPVMYLITRDGQAMQTSHLKAGDLPRQPDARGW